jgi:hypothetical protein
MDILAKHYDALVNLLFGATFSIAAVLFLVKHGSILGMALALSMGVAFTALGWLALQGFIAEEWIRAFAIAGATGIVFMIQRISRISSKTKIDPTRWCQ